VSISEENRRKIETHVLFEVQDRFGPSHPIETSVVFETLIDILEVELPQKEQDKIVAGAIAKSDVRRAAQLRAQADRETASAARARDEADLLDPP